MKTLGYNERQWLLKRESFLKTLITAYNKLAKGREHPTIASVTAQIPTPCWRSAVNGTLAGLVTMGLAASNSTRIWIDVEMLLETLQNAHAQEKAVSVAQRNRESDKLRPRIRVLAPLGLSQWG